VAEDFERTLGHSPARTVEEEIPQSTGWLASALVTLPSAGYCFADYKKVVEPNLVAPLKDLRTWTFIFCFFSIGLTTRFRELAGIGARPFFGFTAGVVVNVVLGFLLSAVVFASYWTGILEAPQ
jgi:hypothetical protein